MNRVVINLEADLNQQRKDLKQKYGLKLESLDKWIYNEGLRVVSMEDSLFDKMAQAFKPKL